MSRARHRRGLPGAPPSPDGHALKALDRKGFFAIERRFFGLLGRTRHLCRRQIRGGVDELRPQS
jgi:hypothetical protein